MCVGVGVGGWVGGCLFSVATFTFRYTFKFRGTLMKDILLRLEDTHIHGDAFYFSLFRGLLMKDILYLYLRAHTYTYIDEGYSTHAYSRAHTYTDIHSTSVHR